MWTQSKKKRHKITYSPNKNRLTDIGKKLMAAKGKTERDKLGVWGNLYTLLHVKQITNKNLLIAWGTEPSLYREMNHVITYKYESLCPIPETNKHCPSTIRQLRKEIR